MQSVARRQLECIIIKSYNDNALNKQDLEVLDSISKEFSKDGKEAYKMLLELIESKSYEEHYLFSKICERANKDFIKDFAEVSKVAHLAPLLYQYVEYIKLDYQEALANFIYTQTSKFKVLNLDYDLIAKYQYEAIKDSYLTFKDSELMIENDYRNEIYATGIEFLDTAFDGGIATGQLILISGDYEAGKTTLTTQMLENMSARQKVAFFCFEFTLKAYIKRRQAQPNPLFRKENLIVLTDGYDIRDIADNILKLHKQQGIRIFLIDSQMRIENNYSSAGNGEEKESEKFEILGKMAHKLDLIIFLIVQTSKSDPNSPFKSKKGGHEASVIMHLENVDNAKNPLANFTQKRLVVKKNKQTGKHFKEDIFLNNQTGQFVKDPNHTYKDREYSSREAVNRVTLIDINSIPNF